MRDENIEVRGGGKRSDRGFVGASGSVGFTFVNNCPPCNSHLCLASPHTAFACLPPPRPPMSHSTQTVVLRLESENAFALEAARAEWRQREEGLVVKQAAAVKEGKRAEER